MSDVEESAERPTAGDPTPVNVRNFSVKCGACGEYQTLVGFTPGDAWNTYRYECDNQVCDAGQTRTLLEIPAFLDEYAQRDPTWRGGRRHAGGEER